MHFHLVSELIDALVLAIVIDIDQCGSRRIGHLQEAAAFKGHEVTHQRFVAIGIDQGPVLGLGGETKHAVLVIQFHLVRLLRKGPATVSTSANLQAVGVDALTIIPDQRHDAFLIDGFIGIVDFNGVLRVNGDHRKATRHVELRIVALRRGSVELDDGNLTSFIIRTDITYITETS